MPTKGRFKTKYPGVYHIEGIGPGGKPERIFYIYYRKNGRQIEEKVGYQLKDDMTSAKANQVRAARIRGDEPSNKERRERAKKEKEVKAGRWTFTRLWAAYKEFRPILKGLVTDENRFNKHIKPVFGDKEPSQIVPLDIDRLRLGLLKRGKSPGTVKNVLELLRRLVNFGMKKHLCQGPGFNIELPKANSMKTEDLTPEQLKKLLDVIESDPINPAGAMMELAIFTGMRRGELFKLKWDDIKFERGFIHLKDPKGGPDQKIPINETTRGTLERIARTKSPFVFPGRGGKQRVDIKRRLNAIKAAAGLPKDFRPLHGLRHVYASMLASSGKVDLYTLQKLLTHKSPAMTQRYAHLRDEALKRAASVADDLIADLGR